MKILYSSLFDIFPCFDLRTTLHYSSSSKGKLTAPSISMSQKANWRGLYQEIFGTSSEWYHY